MPFHSAPIIPNRLYGDDNELDPKLLNGCVSGNAPRDLLLLIFRRIANPPERRLAALFQLWRLTAGSPAQMATKTNAHVALRARDAAPSRCRVIDDITVEAAAHGAVGRGRAATKLDRDGGRDGAGRGYKSCR